MITNAKEICEKIEEICDRTEKFKGSYFWNGGNGNSSSRESYAKKWSIPQFTFEYDGKVYTAEYSVQQSRNNTYAKGYYTRDGQKTTLTALKNVMKKLQAEN